MAALNTDLKAGLGEHLAHLPQWPNAKRPLRAADPPESRGPRRCGIELVRNAEYGTTPGGTAVGRGARPGVRHEGGGRTFGRPVAFVGPLIPGW